MSDSDHNGEPGCQGSEEIGRFFRNFWDPTTYWECQAIDKRAQKRRCPKSHLFLDKQGKCVHYTEWHWTEPKEPPSRPLQTK